MASTGEALRMYTVNRQVVQKKPGFWVRLDEALLTLWRSNGQPFDIPLPAGNVGEKKDYCVTCVFSCCASFPCQCLMHHRPAGAPQPVVSQHSNAAHATSERSRAAQRPRDLRASPFVGNAHWATGRTGCWCGMMRAPTGNDEASVHVAAADSARNAGFHDFGTLLPLQCSLGL
jgi:hypothetical protein